MRSEMLHHLALYAIQFSFILTKKKKIPLLIFNLFIVYFSCRFHVKMCMMHYFMTHKMTWKTFAYAYKNLNTLIYTLTCMYLLHHFSIRYHVDVFSEGRFIKFQCIFVKWQLTQFKPTLSSTELWHTTRLPEAKTNREKQPRFREYMRTDFSCLVTAL